MEKVEIRPAIEEDIPCILELYNELVITTSDAESNRKLNPDDYRRVFQQIETTPGHDLLVMLYEGNVVGSVVILVVPNLSHRACSWAIVENLIIDPRYRRQGLGKMLMKYTISKAKEAGCYKLVLTSDNRRDEAHQFYNSLGFEASAKGFRLYF